MLLAGKRLIVGRSRPGTLHRFLLTLSANVRVFNGTPGPQKIHR